MSPLVTRRSLASLVCPLFLMAQAAPPPGGNSDTKLAILYGAKLVGGQIAIDVISYGCTDPSYFSVEIQPDGPDLYRLSIIARKQDRCRMAAHIATLNLDLPAVSNSARARFLLMNSFAVPLDSQR